jgi:NAD-dependent dihydropyrimidine dehydrogenase PreA subunit
VTPKRSRHSIAGNASAAALVRALRDTLRRAYVLRLKVHELEHQAERLGAALGPERAAALTLEERMHWQSATGLCGLCLTPCDDHPAIDPWPRREEER